MTDFGQTDFGQPYLPTLAKSDFGHEKFDRLEANLKTGFDLLKLA